MEPIEKTCHSRESGNPVLLTILAKAFNWRFPDNHKKKFAKADRISYYAEKLF